MLDPRLVFEDLLGYLNSCYEMQLRICFAARVYISSRKIQILTRSFVGLTRQLIWSTRDFHVTTHNF